MVLILVFTASASDLTVLDSLFLSLALEFVCGIKVTPIFFYIQHGIIKIH